MDGIARIDRVLAYLDVWVDSRLFPFPKMKVKVVERAPADILALPNAIRRDLESGEREYISGLGDSMEEAVEDLLCRFVTDAREAAKQRALRLDDFEWSAAEDF